MGRFPGTQAGAGMVEVTRTFTVTAEITAVQEYLKDFGNATEWDPGTEACERIGTGPVEVGAKWHNTSKIAGVSTDLTYELTRLEPGRVVFNGTNDTASTTDDITLTAGESPGTTTIGYHATIDFHGAAKLGTPIAKVVFEKIGNDTERSLRSVFGTPPG
jgi:carbon monoxide dehydrogenase subunit G